MKSCSYTVVLTLVIAALATPAFAGDTVGLPAPSGDAAGAFPSQKHFSPYAGRNFPTKVFWGDTHLHTGMSMDAGAFGCRLGPEDAYRFALGEELTSSTGLPPLCGACWTRKTAYTFSSSTLQRSV